MDLTRRGFLAGLMGTAVIAVVSKPLIEEIGLPVSDAPYVDPFAVKAPDGWTYNWARSALLGEPDPENIRQRLERGWTFVVPETHPELPQSDAAAAIEQGGLILMQRPTAEANC